MSLIIEEGDSPDFINIVSAIVNNFCEIHDPLELAGIKIRNWFDHKWLNYSGKGIVPFVPNISRFDVALTDFWKEKTTIPPFHQKRVISETNYSIINSRNNPMEKPIHKQVKDNMNKRIERFSKDGVFFWYSSDSDKSKKASLMIYFIRESETITFYSSFLYKDSWKINKTKGISKAEIETLIKGFAANKSF